MLSGLRSRPASRWMALLVLAAAIGAGGWYVFLRDDAPAPVFETAAVDRGLIEQSVSATGAVQALITVDLSSQISGQIADVKVDFNSKVKAGDLLAVLDEKTFRAKVASAEANLLMATAGIQVQQAAIKKNQALVKKAQEDFDRQRQLAARGVASQSSLAAATAALSTARADLAVAEAQLSNANALAVQRRSDLQQAKIDLERTEIRSPIDGVVITRNIDPGATVAATLSAPVLFQIAQDLSKIQIAALVDEADIGRIKQGDDVTFTVDAYPDQTFRGKVAQVRIGGTNQNNVVTYTVIVRADNPRENLLPGMTTTVRIITGRKDGVLRVANGAVRFVPPPGVPGAEARPRWGRSEAFLEELAELLKLTPEQQAKLKTTLAEFRARRVDAENIEQTAARPAGAGQRAGNGQRRRPAQGGRSARRNAGDAGPRERNLFTLLRGIATEPQMKILQAWVESRRETTRPAVVWLRDGDRLVPRKLRLGLTDEAYSEIAAGALKEGDRVVTRIRTPRKP